MGKTYSGTIDVKRNIRYDTDSFPRRNNWNFDDIERRRGFALDTLNYDIVVLIPALWNFSTTLLLKEIWDVWNENKKQRKNYKHRIQQQTEVTVVLTGYITEKKALREFSLGLSMMSVWQDRPIKVL